MDKDSRKFLVTIFSSLFSFEWFSGTGLRQLKISRHYFFFFLFFFFFFCFFLFFFNPLFTYYLARDSSKSDKKLSTSLVWFPRLNSCQTFSSVSSFFFFFFFPHYWVKLGRTVKSFSSLFCFFLLSFSFCFIPYLLTISRGIVVKKWQEII